MTHYMFNVLNYNPNSRQIEPFNIFRNIYVNESAQNLVADYINHTISYDEFRDKLDQAIRREEHSRREYEISVGDAFETDINKLEKWDCYAQAHANIDIIAHMVVETTLEDMYNTKAYD